MHAIIRLYDMLPDAKMNQRLHEDRFTPRQIIAHLADWEAILRERMVGTIQWKPYEIKSLDEGQRAIDNQYHMIDVKISLKRFYSERLKTLSFVELLPPEAWSEMAHHPDYGAVTVLEQVQMLSGHDIYHIDQLLEFFTDQPVGTW